MLSRRLRGALTRSCSRESQDETADLAAGEVELGGRGDDLVSTPAGIPAATETLPVDVGAVEVAPDMLGNQASGGRALPLAPASAARGAYPARHVLFPHLLDTLRSFLSVIVIALFVLTFIVQPFRIPSESMERTLLVGDFLLVNKMAESPPGSLWFWALPYRTVHRGDIIVFHFPAKPSEYLVKRVIGVPGDHIRLIDGVVYLNGKPRQEPYAIYRGSYPDSFRDQFPTGAYTDPGVDVGWWCSKRGGVFKTGSWWCPRTAILSSATTATTAGTAATGDSCLERILSDGHSSSTSRFAAFRPWIRPPCRETGSRAATVC